MILLQPSVVMVRTPGGKHSRSTQFLSVVGVGHDEELVLVEEVVCQLYGSPQQPTTNNAILQLFAKAKKGLKMLPPTRNTLELHAICVNYQANIWL